MTGDQRIIGFPGRAAVLGGTPMRPAVMADAVAIVAAFPGSACLLKAPEEVIAANETAEPLLAVLGDKTLDPGAFGKLAALIERAGAGAPGAERIYCRRDDDPGAGKRAFDVTVLPVPGAVLLLAQESTLERNLISALKSSRELFRDLVACSSDFAWETDATGAFTYVSRSGAAGFSAEALHGRLAASLVLVDDDEEALAPASPFTARDDTADAEVWLHGADGAPRCYLVSAMPVVDEQGSWKGARGIGRDVTEMRLRERELARVRAREALNQAIQSAILGEFEPAMMLARAASALRTALGADTCWVLERDGGRWIAAAADSRDGGCEAIVPPMLVSALAGLTEAPETVRRIPCGAASGLIAVAACRGEVQGGVCLLREGPGHGFEAEADVLLEHACGALGVALAHVGLVRRLEEQSSTDPLTALMNRRAFVAEAARRVEQHRRMQRPGVLLYIDLDDFKSVNDLYGHGLGDRTLEMVGRVLRTRNRAGDLAVRFGGDEFGLWLEEADAGVAAMKAGQILAAIEDEGRALGLKQRVTVSIGGAVFQSAQPETLEDLMLRADLALYAAKSGGKGCFRLAESVAAGEE